MHSSLNCRQSRRSACDRCRGFKLRCERDQVDGRSCERCLKAQVICTTSINHPSTNYVSSKNGSRSLSAEFDPRLLASDRWSMPVLHKSSNLKVKKPVPTAGFRKQNNQKYNGWSCPDSLYSWTPGAFPSFDGDLGIQMASYAAPSFPFEQWGEQRSQWTVNNHPLISTDNFPLKIDRLDNQASASDPLMVQPPYIYEIPHINAESVIPPQPLNLLGSNTLPTTDGTWISSWPRITEVTEDDKEKIESALDWTATIIYDLRKKLLKLNLEMTDDLELLETDNEVFRFSPLLSDDIAPSVDKLDLPIFRALNYSTRFLEMLQTLNGTSNNAMHILPSIELPQMDLSTFDDSRLLSLDSLDNNLEDGTATASSHDSGYHTIVTSPSDLGKGSKAHKCDLSTSLNILTTYLQLVRVYQLIFNRLYQLFLIIPPDATTFLLLPSIQFGQFHMNGNLAMQVQSLIEFSSNVLAKVELALGLSSSFSSNTEESGNPIVTFLGNRVLASIQDHVVAQEHMECGMSLKDTMNCLRKLAMDSICV